MAPKLPEDTMEEVVLRLPAKAVGRFRCVSKLWRSRLSSPTFVKAHSKFHIHTAPVSIIFEYPLMDYADYMDMARDELNDGEDDYLVPYLINEFNNDMNDWRNSMFDYHPPSPSGSEDSYDHHNHSERSRGRHLLTFAAGGGVGKLVTSPLFEKGLVSVVAALDGFVVVEIETDEDNSMFLFNPLTKETLKLPRFRSSNPGECRHFLGLGYDSLNDDYKIVRLSYSKRRQDGTFVDVYSFKMKSWRNLGKSPYHHKSTFPDPCPGVFVNGCLHWLARDSEGYVIAAFDLAKEEFKEVPSPPKGSYDSSDGIVEGSECSDGIVEGSEWSDGDYDDYNFDEIPEVFEGFDDTSQVVVFGRCLAVVCTPSDDRFDDRIDVWVMREYGAQESWNKLMIITSGRGIGKFVCLLREDEVVFRTFRSDNEQFAAYSLSGGTWRYIVTDGDPYECLDVEQETGVVTFTDSLLSPSHILD